MRHFLVLAAFLVSIPACLNTSTDPVTTSDQDLLLATDNRDGDRPYDKIPAFDFADDFYLANGIDPGSIVDRLVAQDGRSVVDTSPREDFVDTRIVETTGGFDHKGNLLYYVVTGKVMLAIHSISPPFGWHRLRGFTREERVTPGKTETSRPTGRRHITPSQIRSTSNSGVSLCLDHS